MEPLPAALRNRNTSSAICDNFLQRARLRVLCKLPKGCVQTPTPRVSILPFNLVLKTGRYVSLAEAHTIQFISRYTSIPVPRILTAYESTDGEKRILMSRIRGVPLSQVFHDLSEAQQYQILSQLRDMIDELRKLQPPKPGYVGSVDGTPLHDERVHNGPLGPFSSISDFHRALRHNIDDAKGHQELESVIQTQQAHDYRSHMTHGDLSFRNIITKEGKIVGIVDWETAGWYPDYWEYTSAYYSFFDCLDLRERIVEFLEPFPAKMKLEQTRRRLFNMTQLLDSCLFHFQ